MGERVKPVNRFQCVFPAKSVNESFARTVVSSFVSQLDPRMDELSDLKTAVSEAVTNCIVHAYREKIDKVYITASIYPDSRIVIKIKDNGCGIADVKKAMEPLFTTAPEEERAGLGFAVMESLMDKVKVSSKLGKGTTVTLEKKIFSKGSAREMLPEGENHAHDGRA